MPNGMTIEAAAKHLGVSDRMVRGYIQEGLLTAVKAGRIRYLSPVEVEELRVEKAGAKRGRLLPGAELQQMKVRVRRLEVQLSAVLRILDAKDEPLGIMGETASGLYAACQARIQNPSWALSDMTSWIDVLLRLTEEDFHEVRAATGQQQPWRPFLQLCHLLLGVVGKHSALPTSLDLQAAHRSLGEARRRLRLAAVLYIEGQGGEATVVSAYFIDDPRTVVDTVETALKKAKPSTA